MHVFNTVPAHMHDALFFYLEHLTLNIFLSGEDVNKNNSQTNVEENDHADHNRIWPLKRNTETSLQPLK